MHKEKAMWGHSKKKKSISQREKPREKLTLSKNYKKINFHRVSHSVYSVLLWQAWQTTAQSNKESMAVLTLTMSIREAHLFSVNFFPLD